MRIPRVYVDQALEVGLQVDLPGDRAHYLANVLRLTPGRPLILFNGAGGEYSCTLVTATKKSASVQVEGFDSVDRESALRVELAIGISRGDRMDWVVQKATELGVAVISPLYTENTEVKLKGDRQAKKMSHWQQIAISACEQSQRSHVPAIKEPLSLHAFLDACEADLKLILHPAKGQGEPSDAKAPKKISVLIGPEGGFNQDEVDAAQGKGFRPWQLGPRILRTETAPLVALALLQHRWGDLGGL